LRLRAYLSKKGFTYIEIQRNFISTKAPIARIPPVDLPISFKLNLGGVIA
jgi:hypothetical protein